MSTRILTLSELAEIQDKLNHTTVPNWRQELCIADYRCAAFAELYEFMESTNWKWWKHSNQFDNWNMKVELVDVLHFIMSIQILNNTVEKNKDFVFGQYRGTNIMVDENGRLNRSAFINGATRLVTNYSIDDMETMFLDAGMDAEEISALYTAKSELNFIRQSNGYKDGTYVKIVDGVEDNVKLETLVTDFLIDYDMTLDGLRDSVKNAFFTDGKEA